MTDTTPALDDVGAALALRLQARGAARGVGTASKDPASRAWSRTRDDSGAPGASPRRARLLARVMEGFGTALPAWDRWGQDRGATVLRVLGEAYVLSPDGFVWVVPQAEDAADESSAVSGWTRAPRRAPRPSASVGRPASKRASPRPALFDGSEAPEPVLVHAASDAPDAGDHPGPARGASDASDAGEPPGPARAASAESEAVVSAPARARRRGRAVARAAARAVPSRGVGRTRPLSGALGRSSSRGAWEEDARAPWAPIAAAHARLDAPEAVRRSLPAAPDPVWLAAAEGEDPAKQAARPATWTTSARRASAAARVGSPSTVLDRARGGGSLGLDGSDPRQVSDQAARAAARPLARAARRSEVEPLEAGVASRSILPRVAGARGSLGGLAAPRTRPSRAAEIALVGLDGAVLGADPTAVRIRAVAGSGDARAHPSAVGRISRDSASRPTHARTVAQSGGAAEASQTSGAASPADGAPRVSATARALERATRADAARVSESAPALASSSLAAPPMSWFRPEAGLGVKAGGDTLRAGPVAHAQRRASAGPTAGSFAPTGALVAAGGAAPDAFADAVRARREALAPVRSATRSLLAPETVLLDAGSLAEGSSGVAAATAGASSAAGIAVAATGVRPGRARPTARLRDRGASPEERRAVDAPHGLDSPVMTLAESGAGEQFSDVASSPARGGHVTLAAWRRALSSAPKDVASALASSPELGAKVVAAMRQMKALPPEEAKPLHARTASPAGVSAPSQRQEARREKTAAALATLRGSPMRTRADRPNTTRLTRLASKLEGLVHLVESEQRDAEAQRWVRRASEPAEASGATTATAAGAQDMSLDTLQREVLDAVMRELERAQERGEGIGHATADW